MASVGFRAVSALAIGKWIALSFGPLGTALFGQLMNLYSTFSSVPYDGLGRAMVKEGSLAHKSEDKVGTKQILGTSYSLLIFLFCSLWSITIVISYFTNWFEPFQSGGYFIWMILGFGALASAYFFGMTFLIWQKTNIQAIIASGLSVGGIISILFAHFFQLEIQLTLLFFIFGQTLGGFLVLFLFRNSIPQIWVRPDWNPELGKKLINFTFAFSITILISQIGNYVLVHWALNTIGSEKTGLWTAMNRLADVFNIPILAIANTILLPLISGISSHVTEVRNTIKPIFIRSLAALGLGIVILFFMYPAILPLFFSAEFVADSQWIAWQLSGDFFKSSTYLISILILALGHTRFYVWLEIGSVILILCLSFFLFHQFGFVGMFMAHFIRFLFYWAAIVMRYRKLLL